MFYKKGETLCPVKPKRNVDFFVSNTASLVSKPDRPERQHPCPRAVDIAEQIISNFSVGTVLDPFAGSDTIGVACKNLNRNYILIEKEKEYIDIINKRLL
jgi:DNA modification methylase